MATESTDWWPKRRHFRQILTINNRSRFSTNWSVVKLSSLLRLKKLKKAWHFPVISQVFFSSLFLLIEMSPSSTGGDAIEHVYDFTSDTATIPTDDMFDIMKMASRGDDVFAVR